MSVPMPMKERDGPVAAPPDRGGEQGGGDDRGERTASLSTREVEVVRLIVDGRTNDEIAARLYLSPRTVHSHVESAMRKAEARNRTALAVLAVRESLDLAPAPGEAPGEGDLGISTD